MFTLRDFIIFLAGAEFFHTLSHLILSYFIPLPLDMKFMVLTPTLNIWITVINAIVTIFLLWLATRLKR